MNADLMISNDVKYIGVNDREVDLLRGNILFQTVWLTILM